MKSIDEVALLLSQFCFEALSYLRNKEVLIMEKSGMILTKNQQVLAFLKIVEEVEKNLIEPVKKCQKRLFDNCIAIRKSLFKQCLRI